MPEGCARGPPREVDVNEDDRDYERGAQLGNALGGEAFSLVVEKLRATDEALAGYLVAHAYGQVMSRSGLALTDRELVVISALAAQGHLPQLKWHIAAALKIGVPAEAIREVLIQVIPFAGWPAALNALGSMRDVFSDKGIALTDLQSVPPSSADPNVLTEIGRRRGSEIYADYAGVERAVAAYDPELPRYLTENAYGQICDRPGLDMRRRELIAVAMLTVLQRLQQLGVHIDGAHRVGCTKDETKEVIVTMIVYAGWPAALNALEVWREKSS